MADDEVSAELLRGGCALGARGRGDDEHWGYRERGALYNRLMDEQLKAFDNIAMDDVDKTRFPILEGKETDLIEWSLEYEKLMTLLSPQQEGKK